MALFTPLSPTFLYKKKADKKRKHKTPKDKKALKKKFPFPKKLKISLPLKKPAPTTPPINKNDNFNTLKKLFTRIDYATRVNNLTFLFNLLFFAFYFLVNFIVWKISFFIVTATKTFYCKLQFFKLLVI